MRLAAEYQQGNKKQEQRQQNGRKYIVRLGKGIPGQQKRKRGISISQNNSHFQEQSLGKNQVSKEKQRQQVLTSQRQVFVTRKPPQEKVLASVATYANQPKKVNGYAAEHLFDMKPKETQPIMSTGKYISGVRSQENLAMRQNYHLLSDKNIPQIIAGPIINTRYISPKSILISQSRPASKSSRNMVEINSKIIQNPSNIRAYETSTIQQQQGQLFRSNPASIPVQQAPRLKSEEPVKINVIKEYKSQVKDFVSSRRAINQKEELAESTRNTQKLISSQTKIDPYSLSSLKLTKKNEQYEKASEELIETKKYLKGVPQCKEISSSNVSGGSKSNMIFSRTGPISLWDANKVESIVSMKSSREIKVQQSEIMHDYFHPSESMLKKI